MSGFHEKAGRCQAGNVKKCRVRSRFAIPSSQDSSVRRDGCLSRPSAASRREALTGWRDAKMFEEEGMADASRLFGEMNVDRWDLTTRLPFALL